MVGEAENFVGCNIVSKSTRSYTGTNKVFLVLLLDNLISFSDDNRSLDIETINYLNVTPLSFWMGAFFAFCS
jgi:hypothetical protein